MALDSMVKDSDLVKHLILALAISFEGLGPFIVIKDCTWVVTLVEAFDPLVVKRFTYHHLVIIRA